jgi:hypothetical protein
VLRKLSLASRVLANLLQSEATMSFARPDDERLGRVVMEMPGGVGPAILHVSKGEHHEQSAPVVI